MKINYENYEKDFWVCEVDKSLKSNLHSVFSQIICFHQSSGVD